MEALYWRPPNPEELDGFVLEDFPPPTNVELWAENWPAIQLFRQNASQWREGMNGPVGLDYNVIFHELDRQALSPDDYDDLMGCIRIIEGEALKHLHKPA